MLHTVSGRVRSLSRSVHTRGRKCITTTRILDVCLKVCTASVCNSVPCIRTYRTTCNKALAPGFSDIRDLCSL